MQHGSWRCRLFNGRALCAVGHALMDPVLAHGWQGSAAGAASPGSLMAWLHAVLERPAVPLRCVVVLAALCIVCACIGQQRTRCCLRIARSGWVAWVRGRYGLTRGSRFNRASSLEVHVGCVGCVVVAVSVLCCCSALCGWQAGGLRACMHVLREHISCWLAGALRSPRLSCGCCGLVMPLGALQQSGGACVFGLCGRVLH